MIDFVTLVDGPLHGEILHGVGLLTSTHMICVPMQDAEDSVAQYKCDGNGRAHFVLLSTRSARENQRINKSGVT